MILKVTSKKYRTNRKGYDDMYKLEASDVLEEANHGVLQGQTCINPFDSYRSLSLEMVNRS